MRFVRCTKAALFTGLWLAIASPVGRAENGVTVEGPLTVFRSGTNGPLVSLSLPLDAAATNQTSVVRFEFGFGTDEPDLPGTFFDSFSITLQNSEKTATALLLTADRTGVQWTPPNPGGLTLSTNEVTSTGTVFAEVSPEAAFEFAYSVSFLVPLALLGGPITVLLDLFDNGNTAASLAYVKGMRIEAANPGIRLQAAATVNGPYAEDAGALLDETNRLFTVGKAGGNQFYRVSADRPTRIVSIRDLGQQVRVGFKYETAAQLSLWSSPTAGGPFVVESAAFGDAINQTFALLKPATNRFFRIGGNRLTRITGIREVGSQVEVEYRVVEIRLLSSGSVTGPYGEETGAELNETNRTFTVGQPDSARFYQVVSEVPMRIVSTRTSGGQVVIEYALMQPRLTLQSATTVKGPYVDEGGTILDEGNRTMTVSRPGGNRFYRLESDRRTKIRGLRQQGADVVLEYELVP